MDREELLRLAGEQVLLRREHETLTATQHRDKEALLGLYNAMNTRGADAEWLAGGIALLNRLHETRNKLATMAQRISELGKLTGL